MPEIWGVYWYRNL